MPIDDNGDEYFPVKPGNRRCTGHEERCGTRMTWAAEKVQYGRAMKVGMTPDEYEAIAPRCQKCMTTFLKARAAKVAAS